MRFVVFMVLVAVGGCVFQESPEIPANNGKPPTPCEHACDLLLGGCAADVCGPMVSGQLKDQLAACLGTGGQSCQELYATNQDYQQSIDGLVNADCSSSSVAKLRCQSFGYEACGCATPMLLNDCTESDECESEYLQGVCLGKTANRSGQCFYAGCSLGEDVSTKVAVNDLTGCGLKNACIMGEGNMPSFCLQTCDPDRVCRDSFGCRANGNDVGYCERKCTGDADCTDPTTSVCADSGIMGRRFCAPGCDVDDDCDQGQDCRTNPEGTLYCANR